MEEVAGTRLSAGGLDYKVVLAIIFVVAFVLDLGIVLGVVYAQYHAPPQPNPPVPINVTEFLGKLVGIFGAPIGVIAGGMFASRGSSGPIVDRSLIVLLYVLSVAWSLILVGATLFQVLTSLNIIDTIGPGIAVLTTTPLAFVFTRTEAATNSVPSRR